MRTRYAWQLPEKLKIRQVDGGYIISLVSRPCNVVHGDMLCFVIYGTLEEARDAAKHLSELRAIKYYDEKLD